MNAVPKMETPQAGARRLFARDIAEGFAPVALHCYADADGQPLFYRPRLKHPDGRKVIKPMRLDGLRYAMGEPPAPKEGKPLYRLPELLADTAAPVWIVEGESCADALAKAGNVATTSGGASSADGMDWTPLRGRSVILWPDHDGPGAEYADKVAGRLRALGCDVRRIDVAALNLPDGGDVVDWLAANPGGDLDTLPMLAAPAVRVEGFAPEPLRRPVPPPEPYPLAELGPVLQPAAESLRRVIQAPDAVCGASVLAAASLAAQALADVEIDGRTVPLSLWMLTVAESGERKSAVDAEAMRAARDHEKALAKSHEVELEAHAAELAEWEARCTDAKTKAKKSQGAGLARALQDIGPAPPAPLLPRVTVADFTAEGLAKLLAAGWPTVGAFTDEAALVFGGHGMTKETVTRTAGTLCKLWDSGTLDRVRAMDGATKLHGRRMALHLLAQPVIAERALSDDVLSGQGFLARCLLAWPQSTAGTRPYKAESLRHDAALGRMAHRLGELHREPLPLAEGERQELQPRPLHLSAKAKAAWVQLHDAVEAGMTPGGQFATVKPWASKTPEQVLRIAGVLSLLESTGAQEIDAATIGRAAELALWHLNEAARLAGTAELSPEVRDAEALLGWCHDTGRTLLYSRDALRLGPGRIRERETFTRAMGELERAGWAEPVEGGAVLDGRHRRHVWRIAPAPEGG
ncbi:hypothetical protein B1992_01760 [Pseudoxanthomonas broegbernensis]|uniref:DUF3987 domain-containing protein n=1 Tax=Pseudoxanthomonas broegbernensis TaxID=83619 RepID=A0A7V8GQ65_9GAMM|nr:YfjI family protein [Pseudoxanthomonas broegbernensis]KAF1688165.1 hypothetical protein B1992_01760 [Pseudoxanthomonas broegbernensis]MBB6065217.1 hypothetical protein [Pseudoxanthomonas broegbernensis]